MFVLAKLVSVLVQPSLVLVLLAVLGLALRRRWVVALAVWSLLAVMVLPLDQLLAGPLEDRLAQPEPPPAKVDGIVALGGSVDEEISNDRNRASLNGAGERLTETVALARRYPDAKIVFTGGSGRIFPGAMVEADIVRMLFTQLGLAPERVTYESRSRTTAENATFTRDIVKPQPGETWLLVTSALHMPRSVATFRKAGWSVTPWPVGYKTGGDRLAWSQTPAAHISLFDQATHEWVGLLAYRLMGDSATLLPATQP